MHLIINSVFLIAFQFINLSNFKLLVMVLWVNDRCKWITVILINLCDNLLYYMIYLRLLSFVFVSLSSSYFSATHPVPLSILWIYYALPTNTLPFLFLESWITFPISVTCPYFIAQLPHNKQSNIDIFSNLSLSLSLSIYIYIYVYIYIKYNII